MWNPIAYALALLIVNISVVLTIVPARTEASVWMLEGSPYEYLHKPILNIWKHMGQNPYSPRSVQFYSEEEAETRVTGLVVAKVRQKLSLLMHTSVLVMYQESAPPTQAWSDFDNIYKLDTGRFNSGLMAG